MKRRKRNLFLSRMLENIRVKTIRGYNLIAKNLLKMDTFIDRLISQELKVCLTALVCVLSVVVMGVYGVLLHILILSIIAWEKEKENKRQKYKESNPK